MKKMYALPAIADFVTAAMVWIYVYSKLHMLELNPQGDGVKRWDLWGSN
jgi:hypothetical protein